MVSTVSTPLQQRIPSPPPGQSRYALRSQGPVADPADTNNPLEVYRYNTNRQRYVPKRQRDSSQERTCDNDKRPRIQCDVDCLSSGTTDPNVAPIQHSFVEAETASFDVLPTWQSMVYKVLGTMSLFYAAIMFLDSG